MAETIEDLDVVTLIRDLPEEGLPAGQAGTVVFMHRGGAAGRPRIERRNARFLAQSAAFRLRLLQTLGI